MKLRFFNKKKNFFSNQNFLEKFSRHCVPGEHINVHVCGQTILLQPRVRYGHVLHLFDCLFWRQRPWFGHVCILQGTRVESEESEHNWVAAQGLFAHIPLHECFSERVVCCFPSRIRPGQYFVSIEIAQNCESTKVNHFKKNFDLFTN